jgi:hypothetical protein
MAKETFTASIELTEDEAALVRKTAAYFKMELSAFLSESFRSGLAHAEDHMAMQEEMPASSPDNRVIDDGIPF